MHRSQNTSSGIGKKIIQSIDFFFSELKRINSEKGKPGGNRRIRRARKRGKSVIEF